MSYVIQQPHSNTNLSARFRVVDFEDWLAYLDGEEPMLECHSFDTYPEAQAKRDELNNDDG